MTDEKARRIFGLMAIAAFLLAALVVILSGCMTAPEREEFDTEECFYYADCLWRLKDTPDKSACASMIKECQESVKEKRIKKRLEYCSEKKFTGMTENECRMFLNQK